MTSLENILEDELKKANGLEPATLGKVEAPSFSEKDKRQLISHLRESSKFNNGMVIVIIVLHVVLFGTAVFLVYYFLSTPNVITYLLGGSVFSIMVLIYSLIRLLQIKNANDLLKAALPYLPPNEAMVLIQTTYFGLKKRRWL